jgi:hypothetical protein
MSKVSKRKAAVEMAPEPASELVQKIAGYLRDRGCSQEARYVAATWGSWEPPVGEESGE